jgi:hypothetical protein
MALTETSTALTGGKSGVVGMMLPHFAPALLAMMVLAVHTVTPAQKVTLVMLPGVSLIVFLVLILLITVLWRKVGTSTA